MNLAHLAIQTSTKDSLEIWQKHFQMTRRSILKGHGNGIVSKITFWITTCLLSSYESIKLDEVLLKLLVCYVSTYFLRLFLFWPLSKLKRQIYSFMIVLLYQSRFMNCLQSISIEWKYFDIGIYQIQKPEINLSSQVSAFIWRYKWVDILQIRLKTLFLTIWHNTILNYEHKFL